MRLKLRKIWIYLAIIFVVQFCLTITHATAKNSNNIPIYTYRIVNTFLHDPSAYTQGLTYYNGMLYEGTGLNGRSSVRKIELETGAILQENRLPDKYFGEGITIYQNKIIQLTWQSYIGIVYDLKSLIELEKFYYFTEGWGLTHDGSKLIMSDGSANLYFMDPHNFSQIGKILVKDDNGPVTGLNELEYINGEVFANVYPKNRIAIISPETGKITAWLNLQGLLSREDRTQQVDVLNGIAYDAENDRIFVTGKLWPKLFEIKLLPQN